MFGIIPLIILILLLIAIVPAIFKWLWNITMPQVFGLKEITFWQAVRILLLSYILFGGGYFSKFNHQSSQQAQQSNTTFSEGGTWGGQGQAPVPIPQEHKPFDAM